MKQNKRKGLKNSVLRKTFPFLKIISKLPKKSRGQILKATNGDQDILRSLREMAVNVKLGNLKIDDKLLKKNLPYIEKLSKTRMSECTCAKRKRLVQKGEGLIAAAIPILTSLLSSLFAK